MTDFADRAAWIVEDEAGGKVDLPLRVGRVRQLLWASGADEPCPAAYRGADVAMGILLESLSDATLESRVAAAARRQEEERLIDRLVADVNAARREESRKALPRVIFVSIAARTKEAILREADDYLLPDPQPDDGCERIAGARLRIDRELCEGWRIVREEDAGERE